MTKRQRITGLRLVEIEAEFHPLLVSCLQQCSRGRWGLFGQNDLDDPEGRYWTWPEAQRLKELAHEIQSIRLESDEANEDCDRFLNLCSLRGADVLGEPKLAAKFLLEIGATRH